VDEPDLAARDSAKALDRAHRFSRGALRVLALSAAFLPPVVSLALPRAAQADDSWVNCCGDGGGPYVTQGGDKFTSTVNGTHSYITRYSIASAPASAGVLFVRVQTGLSIADGMIQTGYHRSTISNENCGSSGVVDVFVEWNQVFTTNYNCAIFSTSNTGDRFGVVKSSTTNYWGAYRNGVLLGSIHYVGFVTAGSPQVTRSWAASVTRPTPISADAGVAEVLRRGSSPSTEARAIRS
jgi:hypothetical protein